MASQRQDQTNHRALPLEVICTVLESGRDLNDLLQLVKTSPIFLQAWRWAPRCITSHVLKNSRHGYNDAKELAFLQILFPRPDREKGTSRRVVTDIRFVEADVSFLALMVGNVNAINFARRYFVRGLPNGGHNRQSLQPKRPERPFLTANEQRRFNHAYYRAWTFVTAAREPTMTDFKSPLTKRQLDFISKTSPREIWRIREMLFYIRREFPTAVRAKLYMQPSASPATSQQLFNFHMAEIRIRSIKGRPIDVRRVMNGYYPDAFNFRRAEYPWDDAIFALSLNPERLSSIVLIPGQLLRMDDILPIVQNLLYSKVFYSGVFDDNQKYLELLPDTCNGLTREEAMQKLCLRIKHNVFMGVPRQTTMHASGLAHYEIWDMMGPGCSEILSREEMIEAGRRAVRQWVMR